MIFLRKDKKMEYLSHSPEETIELGKKIAQKLHKNQVILLCGDLGAGKTKLTEGILTYFGLENEISSPTFAIVNEYNTDSLDIKETAEKSINIKHLADEKNDFSREIINNLEIHELESRVK